MFPEKQYVSDKNPSSDVQVKNASEDALIHFQWDILNTRM